jgi:hypothetical protein
MPDSAGELVQHLERKRKVAENEIEEEETKGDTLSRVPAGFLRVTPLPLVRAMRACGSRFGPGPGAVPVVASPGGAGEVESKWGTSEKGRRARY